MKDLNDTYTEVYVKTSTGDLNLVGESEVSKIYEAIERSSLGKDEPAISKPMLYVKLDEILEERGMTRKKLAELTGLRPNVISEICNNQRTTVNREHIGRIAEVLNIEDVSELLALHKK